MRGVRGGALSVRSGPFGGVVSSATGGVELAASDALAAGTGAGGAVGSINTGTLSAGIAAAGPLLIVEAVGGTLIARSCHHAVAAIPNPTTIANP